MRAWSWKYSRWRSGPIAQHACACSCGAQCAENGTWCAWQSAADREQAGDAAAARGVGLQDVDRAGREHPPEVGRLVAVLAGRDLHRRPARGRAAAAARRGPRRTPAPRTSSPPPARRSARPGRAPACARRRRWRRRTAPRRRRSPARAARTRARSSSGWRPTFIFTRGIPSCTQPASCCCRRSTL